MKQLIIHYTPWINWNSELNEKLMAFEKQKYIEENEVSYIPQKCVCIPFKVGKMWKGVYYVI